MKTTTDPKSATASADSAVIPPPARTKLPSAPETAAPEPGESAWLPSLSAASESTLRHLVHSGESANFQGVSSVGPRFR